jgi:hypothetical protein
MEIIHIYETGLSLIIKTINAYAVTPIVSPYQLIGLSKRQEVIPVQAIIIVRFTI